MNSHDMVEALRPLPQVRLRLIELAWKIVREDGSPDPDRLAFHHKELVEAIAEAEAYEKATKGAVLCLRRMGHSQL